MPRKVVTTCDICGEPGASYPAFFWVRPSLSYEPREHPTYGTVTMTIEGPLEVIAPFHINSRVGPHDYLDVREDGVVTQEDRRGICLCPDHFWSLVHATGDWLRETLATSGKPSAFCDACRRPTWDESRFGQWCQMPQPNGSQCTGHIGYPVGKTPPAESSKPSGGIETLGPQTPSAADESDRNDHGV